ASCAARIRHPAETSPGARPEPCGKFPQSSPTIGAEHRRLRCDVPLPGVVPGTPFPWRGRSHSENRREEAVGVPGRLVLLSNQSLSWCPPAAPPAPLVGALAVSGILSSFRPCEASSTNFSTAQGIGFHPSSPPLRWPPAGLGASIGNNGAVRRLGIPRVAIAAQRSGHR